MSLFVLVAHVAAMRAAFDRGDLDEVARQGQLAGPVAIERSLMAADRSLALAAIAAAPGVTDAPELLPALALIAGGPDRRTAIPAARAAVAIAHRLARAPIADDDLASDDLSTWRLAWDGLAMRRDRFVEVRVAALEVAADLAVEGALGFELVAVLAEPDAAVREAAIELLPVALPSGVHDALAGVLAHDLDDGVALAAADALCLAGGVPAEAKPRVAKLVKDDPRRPAARCAR